MIDLLPDSYLAKPASGRGPGVIVLPAWWGLNDFFKSFCDRLAGAGYLTLGLDLYHGKTAITIDEAKRLRSKLNQKQVQADLLTGTDYLLSHPSLSGKILGTIGFSLGAYWALWLSLERPEAIGAVVTFYGTRNADYSGARAAYLGHFAESDEWVSQSGIKKLEKNLRTAGRPLTFHTYENTGHWFFEQDRSDAYQPQAAGLAWERSLEFLKIHLG
jgi:carboxymethylenebutenolidase